MLKHLYNFLHLLRKTHNLTFEQLANELGLVKQTINNWEKGIRIPSLEASILLAQYFSVSLDYLVGLSDDSKRLMILIMLVSIISLL